MRINLVNRKTGKSDQIDLRTTPIQEVKRIASAAATSSSHYLICVIADSEDDIDFIGTNFHNVPLPSFGAEKAIWTGDLAIFIMLNYPTSEVQAA